MSQIRGKQDAIQIAIEKLRGVDLAQRCALLDLPRPTDGSFPLRVFGRDYRFDTAALQLVRTDNGEPAKEYDLILVLHYLLYEAPLQPTGQLITFRDFPGGQFYWQPFLSRTADPVVKRIGNDLDLLRKNLDRFDWEPYGAGDCGAKVHALGKFHLYLIYHCGDEEFPPAADVLFDSSVKRVYCAEDAAALASRICLSLL